MKNHCNLAVFVRQNINANKLVSLLEEADLKSRILPHISVEDMERILSERIDYAAVDERIDKMRKNSEEYLTAALNGVRE